MAQASQFGQFRLRSSAAGHEKDVKALVAVDRPDGSFASASRDRTTRVWCPVPAGTDFIESWTTCTHQGFVNAVAWLAPCPDAPDGLLYTGGMDKLVLAFRLDSPEPVARLKGHESNVCHLSVHASLLLSASWDQTARLWRRNQCVCTLRGHSAAVWSAIGLSDFAFATAGADKLLKVWRWPGDAEAECQMSLEGHGDCVRALCLADACLLSASNDATVRGWNVDAGQCEMVYSGHSGFVYSLAALPHSAFASSGEDRTCRIWLLGNAECVQTLAQPCQSVWAVCCLGNGDLAVGGSDSTVRVYTDDESRQADAEAQATLEAQLASSSIPARIGDVATERLPGPELLDRPGRAEGQVVMVRRDNAVEAYQWSAADAKWAKVGDVVGGAGGETASAADGGKQIFEGREYDFVFTVDVEEGKPPLRLPYNRNEDPWLAAQAFINRHCLPQAYLEQVANFITTNAGEAPTLAPAAAYSDPFTGASRYVPGTPAHADATAAGDPFTGANRYVPGSGGAGAPASSGVSRQQIEKYIPHRELRQLTSANVAGLKKKLQELNSEAGELALPESTLLAVDAIVGSTDAEAAAGSADSLLAGSNSWPLAKAFPLLDLLRLCAVQPAAAARLVHSQQPTLLQVVQRCLAAADSTAASQMLTYRLLANLANVDHGAKWLLANASSLLVAMATPGTQAGSQAWLVAAAAACANLLVLLVMLLLL